jgi:nicotinate phosphoribosyltransferase
MRGDVLLFEEEALPEQQPVRAFHPMLAHVHKTYPPSHRREEILVPVFQGGKLVYSRPTLQEIQARTFQSLHHLRPEHKRLQNPHIYHVSLGEKLFRQKQELIKAAVG